MSIIVPAGNKTVNWSPKDEVKLTKTASTGAPEVQEEVSPLYLAAKKFDDAKKTAGLSDLGGSSGSSGSSGSAEIKPASSGSTEAPASSAAKSAHKCPECGKSTSTSGGKSKSTSGGISDIITDVPAPMEDPKGVMPASDEPVIEFDTDDGSSSVIGGGSSEGKGDLAEVVEELKEVVIELKDAVCGDEVAATDGIGGDIGGEGLGGDVGGMEAPKSIEIEVKKDGMDGIPGNECGDGDIVKESNPEDICACAASKKKFPWEKSTAKSGAKASSDAKSGKASSGAKSAKSSSDTKAATEVGMDKSAKSEEFIKVAMLTPSNRKKLADYWVNMLGFPKDYVGLMVKDYEK